MIRTLPTSRPRPGAVRSTRRRPAAVTAALVIAPVNALTLTLVVAVAVVGSLAAGQALAAEAPTAVQCNRPPPTGDQYWHHPVHAQIVDGFRPPAGPYGPGNRGLEYGTTSGDVVSAAAAGVVTFAGPVGRSRFVVVQHPSGLRSTYAYLDSTQITVGSAVVRGQPLATAGPGFHLTARRGETYIDPLLLLVDGCSFVKLVPVPPADRLSTAVD